MNTNKNLLLLTQSFHLCQRKMKSFQNLLNNNTKREKIKSEKKSPK